MADYLDIDKYLPNENPVQNKFSPTHDLRRDYSFNAPSFYDYLGNFNQTFRILAEYSNRNHDLIKEIETGLTKRIDELTEQTLNVAKSFKNYSDTVNQYIEKNEKKIDNIENTIQKNKDDVTTFKNQFGEFAQATTNFSDVVREYIEKDLGSGGGFGNLGDYTALSERVSNVEKQSKTNNDVIEKFVERLDIEQNLYNAINKAIKKNTNDIKDIKSRLDTLTESILSLGNAVKVLQEAILKGI